MSAQQTLHDSQGSSSQSPLYDVFICHASEDKSRFVRPLAKRLRDCRIEVWYDEFSLRPGDSLRRSIDRGMSRSRYGVVVLSPSFFGKGWSEWELDGLVQREIAEDSESLIPIWHKIGRKDVAAYSLPLADKLAIRSDKGVAFVTDELLKVLRPEGSTLLIARDIVIGFGAHPPVVTDDWWLDVAESSASNPVEGTFQESSGWGRWGFPLPEQDRAPVKRGERLAWAAMQMTWQSAAEKQLITQLTRPQDVLTFIDSQPGLRLTCEDYPHYLLCYAPQLGIPGFGGEFEPVFDEMAAASVERARKERENKSTSGTALTTNGVCPACDELFALRHATFGDYEPSFVTCDFVQGDCITGPHPRAFPITDYLAGFLSSNSDWMPRKHHAYLLRGFREWAQWHWMSGRDRELTHLGFVPNESTGALWNEMLGLESESELSALARRDLETRFAFSAKLLSLPETGNELAYRLISGGFIRAWLENDERRRRRGSRDQSAGE